MPKGVEHPYIVAALNAQGYVIVPQMPKGVEHGLEIAPIVGADKKGYSTSDAERR